MGTFKGGLLSLYKGKVGTIVSYVTKLGYTVIRSVGSRTAPFTVNELANQRGTSLVTNLLSPVLEVVRIGFQNIPGGKKWSANNHASSVLKLTALKGDYPDKQIDYQKVVFSVGNIPVPKNAAVELISNKLEFSWEADLDTKGTDRNDRVMIVAYFPETLKAIYLLSGAKRTEGKETIPLPDLYGQTVIETYISYVGFTGKTVSNCVYTGQIITNINL